LFFTSANLKKVVLAKSRLECWRRAKHKLEVNTLTESIKSSTDFSEKGGSSRKFKCVDDLKKGYLTQVNDLASCE